MGDKLRNRFGAPVENIKILSVHKDLMAVLARNLFYDPKNSRLRRQRSTVGSETPQNSLIPGRIADGKALEAIMYP